MIEEETILSKKHLQNLLKKFSETVPPEKKSREKRRWRCRAERKILRRF